MFANLIASAPTGRALLSPSTWGISTGLHVAVVLALLALAGRSAQRDRSPTDRGEVTWVDVAPTEAAAPEPQPETPPPEPAAERTSAPAPPADEPPPPDLVAGFQELQVPPEVVGIPEPVATTAVRAVDFGGRGIAGGVAAGRRLEPTAPPPEPEPAAPTEAYSIASVDVIPRPLNADQMGPRMRELYPPRLRAADVQGRAVVEFVVDTEGRVEVEHIRVIEATHPDFEEATRALVRLLRWDPARRDGRPVRTWVRLPVDWRITR
jgi:protein TonB